MSFLLIFLKCVLVGITSLTIYYKVMMSFESSTISPTAHYTGYVWYNNGISDERLKTTTGAILYYGSQPFNAFLRIVGNDPTIEDILLSRHLIIDTQLKSLIDTGVIGQVIELASGISSRGLRFASHYGSNITYVETDLEQMVNRKKALIGDSLTSNHKIVTMNALLEEGGNSLSALMKNGYIDPMVGTAIVSEGLLGYFSKEEVLRLWKRLNTELSQFPQGVYLTDIRLRKFNGDFTSLLRNRMISLFVKGKLDVHFDNVGDLMEGAVGTSGFSSLDLHSPPEYSDAHFGSCINTNEGIPERSCETNNVLVGALTPFGGKRVVLNSALVRAGHRVVVMEAHSKNL